VGDHVELLRQLVAIDSVNPDLVPGGAGEVEIARFVARWLDKAGLEVEVNEPVPGRPSVVGIARGTGGGKSLMLNAHMDTVGVAGMERPYDPVVEGDRLYGRGAYDMKAGLAAIMLAGAAARQGSLRGDVIVTAVADEENASFGTEGILKLWSADAAIVTEPTELRVCVAHKGFVWLEAVTIGRAAHGSRPDEGIDAIAKMGHVLVGLEELDRALRAQPRHRLLRSGSVHASLITGGQERSSYPERCVLDIERRTIPGETAEGVEAEVRAILDAIALSDPNFRAELQTTLVRDPFEVAEDAEIVTVLRRAASVTLGSEPAIVGETPWMDAALISAAGIPTVVLGPGGTGAHAVVEWSDLKQVGQCVDILVLTATEFCR
jgi:acetylornithine deacetylase